MFEYLRNNGGLMTPPIKQVPTAASTTYSVGQALAANGSGAFVPGTGSTVYVCAADYEAPPSSPADIAAFLVDKNQEYVTTFSTDASAIKEGAIVTIATDAGQATATTAASGFKIIEKYGTGAAGTKVRGQFV